MTIRLFVIIALAMVFGLSDGFAGSTAASLQRIADSRTLAYRGMVEDGAMRRYHFQDETARDLYVKVVSFKKERGLGAHFFYGVNADPTQDLAEEDCKDEAHMLRVMIQSITPEVKDRAVVHRLQFLLGNHPVERVGLDPRNPPDLSEAIREFEALPRWTRAEAEELVPQRVNPAKAEKIMTVCRKYQRLSYYEARELLRLLILKYPYDLEMGGNLYIFNRVYCRVPDEVPRESWKFFGGWIAVPGTEEKVGALWPLKENGQGELELVFPNAGGYAGPSYRAVEEFDYFYKRFGKRELLE
ncbi:MAG: hypothetical protein QM627_10950 [Luteolibacter sp.]